MSRTPCKVLPGGRMRRDTSTSPHKRRFRCSGPAGSTDQLDGNTLHRVDVASRPVASNSPRGDRVALPSTTCGKISAMFGSLKSRQAVWSTVVVIGSLPIFSGCKHVYRGSGVESSVSGPYVQSFDGEPQSETPALHEPLPELSPVPPLPGAGHSEPPEPLPPPAPPVPSVPANTQTEPAEPDQQPVSQTRSFWSRIAARASVDRSASASPLPKVRPGRHAVVASNAASDRTMNPSPAAGLFGVSTWNSGVNSTASTAGETSPKYFHSPGNLAGVSHHQSIESGSTSASPGGFSPPTSRSGLADVETKGPVITPLPQPITTRSGVIEAWPHHSPSSAFANVTPKSDSPPPLSDVPAAVQETATVPSLLPPGP